MNIHLSMQMSQSHGNSQISFPRLSVANLMQLLLFAATWFADWLFVLANRQTFLSTLRLPPTLKSHVKACFLPSSVPPPGAAVRTPDQGTGGWASDRGHPAGEVQAGIRGRQHEQHQVRRSQRVVHEEAWRRNVSVESLGLVLGKWKWSNGYFGKQTNQNMC